jgi:hypothetical protein
MLHANSLECRATEQLIVDSGPSPMIARLKTIEAAFIIDLP